MKRPRHLEPVDNAQLFVEVLGSNMRYLILEWTQSSKVQP